ncbi:MAG TPA: enolase C-terminal domain-like protein [Bryobacteraceae bacterium]|nr:enolase C-terminal domain-like protein [Bryobacteraceae bacterium]
MKSITILGVEAEDRRFELKGGAGTDAIHQIAEYAFAVTRLHTNSGLSGTGLVLTLGKGNQIVCQLISALGESLPKLPIDELMAGFGSVSRELADHASLRWLGPHKGAVHLALASITNACFDLWAKARGVPLWKLLLDLTPREIVNLLDLSYLEEDLTADLAVQMIEEERPNRAERERILECGYPGYDTSVGWFQYGDEELRENAKRALGTGFKALKLKVGSRDASHDIRRATLLREVAGPEARLMLDANQQWTVPEAEQICQAIRGLQPYWIEEPTHPDDIRGHVKLSNQIAPLRLALGEHIPNRVSFRNFMIYGGVHFVQADCTRLAGVSEFITVSLLARKYGLPVVPHVGDMGQIHQHLVLFNHVALGHEALFLEYIPHLRKYFSQPARVENGVYLTPQEPGLSCDLRH